MSSGLKKNDQNCFLIMWHQKNDPMTFFLDGMQRELGCYMQLDMGS